MGSLTPALSKGAAGIVMPFYNSDIGNVMIDQDRLETNLLQLFMHPENSGWFSIISGIILLVNIFDEQKQK